MRRASRGRKAKLAQVRQVLEVERTKSPPMATEAAWLEFVR